MYGIYDIDNDGEHLLAKVNTKEEADKIVSHLLYWVNIVAEDFGNDFEEQFGNQDYQAMEIKEE